MSEEIDPILTLAPYSLKQPEKEGMFIPLLNRLTRHHVSSCLEYARIIELLYSQKLPFSALEDCPYLPVNIFKKMPLASISKGEIFKTLLSSGTTGTAPSQIILDARTAHRQTIALARIMEDYLGSSRLPMLIVDAPNIIKDPKRFNARGAGILGMSHLGRDHLYALDEQMQPNYSAITAWLTQHRTKPFFIFGFTYIFWKHFVQTVLSGTFDLSNGIFFHTGGWKQLQHENIDQQTFKTAILASFNIKKSHSFYGMAEQVGGIFVECEQGSLHCANFAEVIVRNPVSWRPCRIGQEGIVQVLSLLPTSYPGHSLLTEDLGMILGVDCCPCGRNGKTLQILGRVPQAELRGCGDVYALQTEGALSHVP